MIKKIMMSCLLYFGLIFIAHAQDVNIEVNGLVCEFCAVTIEKNFMKQQDIVSKVKVDLEQKKVFLTFKEGQNLSDEEISDIIINNGYNVVKINRN